MTPLLFKVNEKVASELDLIKNSEGLGNRTATFTFLVKYYLLTKDRSLDSSIEKMDMLLSRIDPKKLPSLEEQLNDI